MSKLFLRGSLVTGNTVIDALHWVISKIASESNIEIDIQESLRVEGYNVVRLGEQRRMVLITGHRRENFGEGMINICRAIGTLADSHSDVDFVYPVHLNPNVRTPVEEHLRKGRRHENVFLINPIGYMPFVYLMGKSYLLLTDSGGIQEEAPSLGKPVLVMRDTTERPEAVNAGTVALVGTDHDTIVNGVSRLLDEEAAYLFMSRAINPYGDGKASKRIVEFIDKLKI